MSFLGHTVAKILVTTTISEAFISSPPFARSIATNFGFGSDRHFSSLLPSRSRGCTISSILSSHSTSGGRRHYLRRPRSQLYDNNKINDDDRNNSFFTASLDDDDDESFRPRFDGQLIYGMEADEDGLVKTNMSELKNRAQKNVSTPLSKETKDTDETNNDTGADTTLTVETVPLNSNLQPSSTPLLKSQLSKLRNKIPIKSRTVPIPLPNSFTAQQQQLSITVWELEDPSPLVSRWMTSTPTDKDVMTDPFGVVMWPGSILATTEMAECGVDGKVVVVLGAGTGLEAQAAAPRHRALLLFVPHSLLSQIVFDLFSKEAIPKCDVVVASDILYNESLAKRVARRVVEIFNTAPRPRLIVTDSQRFHGTDFLEQLNVGSEVTLKWEERLLANVTGSGILVDGDQTYDVRARVLNVAGDE